MSGTVTVTQTSSGKIRVASDGLLASRIGYLIAESIDASGNVTLRCGHPACTRRVDGQPARVIHTEDELLSAEHSTCGCKKTANRDFAKEYRKFKQMAVTAGRSSEWDDFRAFFRDTGPAPSTNHQLHRLRNVDDYGNVELYGRSNNGGWILPVENCSPENRRSPQRNNVTGQYTAPPPLPTGLKPQWKTTPTLPKLPTASTDADDSWGDETPTTAPTRRSSRVDTVQAMLATTQAMLRLIPAPPLTAPPIPGRDELRRRYRSQRLCSIRRPRRHSPMTWNRLRELRSRLNAC